MDPITRHDRILDHFRAVVAAVPDDKWDTLTNCEPWTASTIVNHAMASQLLWAQAITGEELVDMAEIMNPQPCSGAPLDRVDEVAPVARAAWATDGILDRQIAGAFGELPGSATIVFPSIDALCHSWDLATSVGVDAELSPELLAAGEELAAVAINETTRSFGLFAEEPSLGPDASPTDRLMAKTGRQRR